MSVYAYPSLDYITTFKDARIGPAGSYASRPFIVESEAGDRYTLSPCSNAAFFYTRKPRAAYQQIKAD